MKEEKLVDLVKKIDAKTASGELNWERTVSDMEFQASLSKSLLRIRRENSDALEPDFVLTILDKNGVVLESVSDVYLNKLWRSAPSFETSFVAMERIFNSARRTALGVDIAINDILSELEGPML